MTDHQHNDNLEQFFRQNLEGYSTEPSGDFWARMEPVIPAKPPFWSGWVVAAGKWVGLGLVAGAIILAGLFWWKDRQQIDSLTKLVQQQQQEIENIRAQQDAGHSPAQAVGPGTGDNSATAPASEVTATGDRAFFNEKQDLFEKNTFEKNLSNRAEVADAQFLTKNKNTPKGRDQTTETGVPNLSSNNRQDVTPATVSTKPDADQVNRTPLETPENLGVLNAQNLTFSKRAPSVKKQLVKVFEPYPRFSFEAGAAAFVMPVRRLFEKDTVAFETGAVRLSLQTGLLVNFEMNSVWMFQTGFHFKNLRSENLSLRYNSFPLTVRRRWAWGRRNRLELKTGFALTTLINAKTFPEKTALPGLESSYFSWLSGGGIALPVGESLTFVTEANLGLPVTPVANGKRPVEAGIYAGLRFLIR